MKKMRQKIAILLLALCATATVNAQVTQGDYTFGFYTSGNAYISAYTGTDTEITIPATITYDKSGVETTVNVVGIGSNSFAGNTTIEKINLPLKDSYTLGASAFKGCTALKTIAYSYSGVSATLSRDNYITLPTGTLGKSVFEGCTSIQNVYAYYYLTGGVGDNAFKGCTSLLTAALTARCSSIGVSAFEGCTALTTVTGCSYKASTSTTTYYTSTTIGANAFKNCTSLKYFGSSTTYAYLGGNSNTNNFTSVTSIGDNAFENCIGFTRAYFHRVTNIGAEAFKGCTSLQYVFVVKADGDYNVLKSGDTDITEITLGEGVFENCTNLVHLYHDVFARGEGNTVTQTFQPNTLFTAIPARAFYGCSKLTIIGGTGSASTTTTSTSLYGGACFPNVTSIGESAFEGCEALASYINLSTSKPIIGANAFKGCTTLTRFGTTLNQIQVYGASVGANAFENCTKPTHLILGEDVTSIGASAFEGCSSLGTVNLYKMDAAPTVGADAFTGIKANSYFYLYPSNSYKSAGKYALSDDWKVYFDGTKGSNFLIAYVNKSKQYGTVSCDVPLYFYSATTAANLYKVKATSQSLAALKEVSSRKLPANTGAVLDVMVGGTVKTSTAVQVLFNNSANADDFAGNLLVANVSDNTEFKGQENGKYNLILVDGEFVKANDGTLAGGLAYLPVALNSADAKLSLTFDDEVTGIENVENEALNAADDAWYTPQGVRVAQPTKGVYIHNGKKVMVK